ncbi:FAD-binding protein [Campylobacter concisus]
MSTQSPSHELSNGYTIPNLYAAGEITGGVHGASRLGLSR